ncbi:MAG: bifunctional phosphopantothenoylcysteine decarboxylase/phosphopantothenate--cysteine ligase CoaBC [Solirubrobacterales bacterium]|nr:bifunctional phosphopantothenoylcysteine decarboxylase/phosphopantothenate--cysteine ligase CoaBC [Solirubrobacterales bacterium]MBV9716480.1 bifunctional phosphopantothenoylcysteine decarboxylase/phosphopantothenate--cysteine ligase CoaBC [Solirubrobacterales bacterium]
MARVLVGVSGGIAAYKTLEAVRLAIKTGHAVRVIQTPTSERFVGRASFAAITGAPVLGGEFEPDPARGAYPGEPVPDRAPISHLALVERAEAYLIAPASANTLAKLAHGFADNLLTAAALAAPCPVAVAPAMNQRMYRHPATQANLARLEQRGVRIVPPGEGDLASHGEYGIGRLAEPAELLEACEALLRPPTWAGLRVLVSAGGTREPIDTVRYIGNRSSGKMAFALAREAARRGAEVTVVAAATTGTPPPQARLVRVQTAAELARACEREFERCDVLLMAAAVADFRPAKPAAAKLKKEHGVPVLELEPTDDVLGALVARRRRDQVMVGFAAEHGAGAVESGRGKMARKRLDAIVVNDISRPGIGFDADENLVTILSRTGAERRVEQSSKAQVARAVLDEVERLRREPREEADGARMGARSTAGV